MSTLPARTVRAFSSRGLIWLFHLTLPLVGLWLLLANPTIDLVWEDHVAHFWLVLATAVVNIGLAAVIGVVANARGDARLLLVSLAFASAAGFFALHAGATPSVLLATPNASFVLSTPIGIVLAGAFGFASSADLSPERAVRIVGLRGVLVALVVAAILGWAVASLVPGSPLNSPLPPAAAQPVLRLIAAVGLTMLAAAAFRYLRVFRRRPSVVIIALVTAFVLLAEALVAASESRSWHASWWEWHVLLLLAFGYVGYSAHVQYRREGRVTTLFRALSLEETVRRLRDEYAAALDRLVAEIDAADESGRAAAIEPLAAGLTTSFGLTEGQAEVIGRAAEALAVERREARRLGLFRRYLSPEVADALLADPRRVDLGGATVEVTVLFGDLRAFTTFAERSEPEDVVRLLNTYFAAIVPLILGEGGTVIQFQGDAFMAIFNAPVRQPDHPMRAGRAALAIQRRVDELGAGRDEWPRFRLGIATGPALVGNVGSEEVRSFTAIGDTVNLAARLQTLAEVGTIVVSGATAERLEGAVLEPKGELAIKGKTAPVRAFELVGLPQERHADGEPEA
jgi:class 3 adenylate cyclase